MKISKILFFCFYFILGTVGAQNETISLIENDNLSVVFEIDPSPNLSKKDWASLTIINNSSKTLTFKTYNYSINTFDESHENGDITIREGALGRSKMYNLLSQYHNITEPNKTQNTFTLKPKEVIRSWKYISNTASATLEQMNINEEEYCALIQVKIEVSDDGKYFETFEGEEPFCFNWQPSKIVKPKLLRNHLEEKILDVTRRRINSAIINTLTLNEEVVRKIKTDLIVKGIINRAYTENHAERLALLKIINSRNEKATNRLIEHYKTCMQDPECHWERDLEFFWDNKLFDTLMANHVFINKKIKILEYHAPLWSSTSNNEKLLNLILEHTQFDFNEVPNQSNFLKWYNKIKLLATARHPRVINYLSGLLDNETFLKIEDWSGQRNKKITTRKDKIKMIHIRICDVAYVSLLRALNQVKIEKDFNGFKLNHSLFIDNKWRGINLASPDGFRLKNAYTLLPLNLNMAEKYYYLGEENKALIKNLIKEINNP